MKASPLTDSLGLDRVEIYMCLIVKCPQVEHPIFYLPLGS